MPLFKLKPQYPPILFISLLISASSGFTAGKVNAQITPDITIPDRSVVTTNGENTEITGGTARGTNLFHSFVEFSVNTGNTAFFDNAASVDRIIGRVTGGNVSTIDGLIRANGSADLFLINPNGIIFGENAALDLGGSFVGSTADSINFGDGIEFSAVNPNDSLLTVNIPAGLQYGDGGDIVVEGVGNNLFIDPDTNIVDRSDRPQGLAVQSGKTLALVGGNVFLEGANLTASQGNIEIGGVSGGEVALVTDELGWKLDYENSDTFQDIGLFDAASLEASGNSGGRIVLAGGLVSLFDGSAILADTQGDGLGGSLTITAADLEIDGEADNGFTSSLFVNVDLDATGNGGDLFLETGSLYIGSGSQVNVNTFGSGDAGTLTVTASEIELFSVSSDESLFSGLYAQSGSPGVYEGLGKGGNINVETETLILDDSAEISVNTFGDGDGGKIYVRAKDIQLLGSFGFGGILSAGADFDSTGNGGNLEINTDTLFIADSSQAIVSTFGEGDAGNLIINANEVELNGSVDGFASGIFASSEFEATGSGGNIEINTDLLLVTDGAQAIAATFGDGEGGDLTINANEVELTGTSEDGSPSALFTAAQTDSTGKGGDLQIRTNLLSLTDSAQIAASTSGSGDAGNLDITAQEINLTGNNEFGASSILSNAFIDTGNGGNIAIATDRLSVRDGATISASNFFSGTEEVEPGLGRAGNITIDANAIELGTGDRFSSITTSTNNLSGGDITLNADSLVLKNGSQITSESKGDGDGGSITANATNLGLVQGSFFSTSTEANGNAGSIELRTSTASLSNPDSGIFSEVGNAATGDGGSLDISTGELEISDNATVSANSQGLGRAGNIAIAADSLNLDRGNITATSMQTGGGNLSLATDSLRLNNNSLISTSVLDSTGGGGNIAIENSSFMIGRNNSNIRADAVLGNGGNINITSQGLFFDASSEITASSQFGVDGVVELNDLEFNKRNIVSLPQRISTPEAVIVSSCPVPEQNTFSVTGLGGMPENPSSYLKGRTVWQDARRFDNGDRDRLSHRDRTTSIQSKSQTQNNTIVESQSWIVNQQGNVELVAAVTPQIGQQKLKCGDF